jgi:hypothetical protein
MGPPLGLQVQDHDGIVVDYFGETAWKRADAATYEGVREILSSPAPDPAAFRRIDWALAPFYCPECDKNYCRADWRTRGLFDNGIYDCTIDICPGGHEHIVDD